MTQSVFVHLIPTLFAPDALTGGVAVMADILRASTTITHALNNGATKVIPCATVEEALQIRQQHAGDCVLLGGERGGVKIDGFDLSNSPDDYDRPTVASKVIGFTTTNGTKALLRSNKATCVLIGCFANLSRVVEFLVQRKLPVHVVCAGTNGEITGEDVLFAGAVVERLIKQNPSTKICDSARIALNHWQREVTDGSLQNLEKAMSRAFGGRNLIKLGYEKDIATASAVDSVPVLGIADAHGITLH